MQSWSHLEAPIRIGLFVSIFIALAMLELAFPRKDRVKPRALRWFSNFAMLIIATVIMRVIFPVLAVAFAVRMQSAGIGLFNIVDLPVWLEIILAVILLDFAIWAQHLVMHYVPPLWAFHKVHHADEDLDASSGIRFHPVEQILSLAFKFAVIALLGPAALAIFLFEVILNASAMFNHASIALPARVDKPLRQLIVTPDMHRVHHSVHPDETNTNFGFCLSVWDRLFRTYRAQPRDGHKDMKLGLDKKPDGNTAGLLWGLILPVKR